MPVHPIPEKNRRRLLIFNLRTDADDHILGFTTQWINALAPYYEAVDVLTTHKGTLAVADNVTVYSTGREDGLSRPQQLARFYQRLGTLITKHHYNACFAHMQPLFASLGAPLLTLRGVATTTWYTHRQINRSVVWAERLSFRIVSAVESSFPLQTAKLRPLGHGINTEFFAPSAKPTRKQPPRIVQVARLTDIKHQHILLEASRELDCKIIFVGDIPDGYDDAYKQRLHQIVDETDMHEKVIFAGAQNPEQVREWYQSATVAVNLSPAGLFDKAALESMACAVPTIVSNPAFAPLTGHHQALLHIPAPDDADSLRDRLTHLFALSNDERQHIGEVLQFGVHQQHSLDSLVFKLIYVMHTGNLPQF
ncbi:MAG: glycosyltransferase family 4 protein [Chloroflexota bacterium]